MLRFIRDRYVNDFHIPRINYIWYCFDIILKQNIVGTFSWFRSMGRGRGGDRRRSVAIV